LAVVGLSVVVALGAASQPAAASTTSVTGDWIVTYGAPAVVTISASGGSYDLTAKTPVLVAGGATCYLPTGTLIATFSGSGTSYSGQHGLWYTSNCAFAYWTSLSLTLSGNTLAGVLGDGEAYTFTRVTKTFQDTSLSIAYDGWRGFSDSTASGGTYRTSATKNATSSFAFSGTGVTWVTRKGPNQGIASVRIGTTTEPPVDLYAATVQPFSKSYTGLSATTHTMVITVTGTKNAASSGFGVVVDAFTVGSVTTQDTSTKVAYDGWGGAVSASASGKTYRVDGVGSATASLRFTGTEVGWITANGPSDGMASITIDGVSKGTVDLYNASVHWQVMGLYSGLASSAHTIVITVLGTHNASSMGTGVVMDAFVVHP
jgi:hypothetical protein